MMDILATVGIVIGCVFVDFGIIAGIWMRNDCDEDAETFFMVGFVVNTMLLFALLTATIANKMIQQERWTSSKDER